MKAGSSRRAISNSVLAVVIVIVLIVSAAGTYFYVASTPARTVTVTAPATVTTTTQPQWKLGLIMPNLAFGGGWYGNVSYGFSLALSSPWAKQNIKLVFETITAQSPADEVSAIQDAQSAGANIIGLASLDQNALVPAVTAATKAGINVFTFGLSLNSTLLQAAGTHIITDVELNNTYEGEQVATWLVNYLEAHPQTYHQPYHIFVHDLSTAASAGSQRLAGVESVFNPLVAKGVLVYTVGPFDTDLTIATAYSQMKAYLATSPKLDAVLALQDVIAVGDIKALNESGLLNNPVVVVGSDLVPVGIAALKSGQMIASAINPGTTIGYWAGQAIVLWARYHTDPSFIPPPAQLYVWQGIATKANLSLVYQIPPLPWTPVPGYTPSDYNTLAIAGLLGLWSSWVALPSRET